MSEYVRNLPVSGNIFASPTSQLDDLLHRICIKLQLNSTRQSLLEERYRGVSSWLNDHTDLGKYHPLIYPQGSVRLGTTNKPREDDDEYDLDFVLQLDQLAMLDLTPIGLLNLIERCLRANGNYAHMVQRKNRCIRLNYAGDFHLDILPAVPDLVRGNTCVLVPDREAKDWKGSNPKGYANWFDKQAQLGQLVEFKAIEDLPDFEDNKPPLKYAVQLLKRARDREFTHNGKLDVRFAPVSILLTTLAGRLYGGSQSVSQTILGILQAIDGEIRRLPFRRLEVRNPTNLDEDFSERWNDNPEGYQQFVIWVRDLLARWSQLYQFQSPTKLAESLQILFGETVTNAAIKEQAESVRKVHENGGLQATKGTGTLATASTASTIAVKTNTFYGG